MSEKLALVSALDRQRQECISAAKELLKKAEAGEIYAFAAVCDCPGNDYIIIRSPNQNSISMLGKIHLAGHRMADRLLNDD